MTRKDNMIQRYFEIRNECCYSIYYIDKLFLEKMKQFNDEYFYGYLNLSLIMGTSVRFNNGEIDDFQVYLSDGECYGIWYGQTFDDYLLKKYDNLIDIKHKIERIYEIN